MIIIMGLCVNIASIFYKDKQFPNKDDMEIIGKIISIKEEKEYYDKYIIKIIYNERYTKTKNARVIIYVDKTQSFLPGDIIYIRGQFEKPESRKNYKGFDYRKYLKQDRLYGIVQIEYIKKIGEKIDFYSAIQNIRLIISKKIYSLYKNEYAEFLNGLLIGKSDGLSENIKNDFRKSSISHVLAISGMHVTYVIVGLKVVFEKNLKNKKLRNYLLIILLFIFCFITGFSESCIRACIMSSMVFWASNIHRKNNFYISLIFSLIIIILMNPYNVFNTGMWLSYSGTIGIVLFYKFLSDLIKYKLNHNKFYKLKINNKFITRIIDNFCVTISAQILILPIMVFVFNTVSLTFFISNVLISFFIGPVLILGYFSIFISYIFFPISKIIVVCEECLIYVILLISRICANIPFSNIYVITPNFILIILYYFIIGIIIYYFNKRKIYILKLLMFNKFLIKELIILKTRIFKHKAAIIRFVILAIIIALIFVVYKNYCQKLKIYFIDVGQGDCTFIQTPKGKNIIIDGGEGNSGKYDYGEKVLLPYLLDRGIFKIDYLIVSHADSDHIGGLFALLNNIKVNKIFIGIQPENSEQLRDLIEISTKKKIEIIVLNAGTKVSIEKDIVLDIFWPINEELIKENALNNNSLVFKLCYNDFSILFTGDIEEIAEKQIVDKYKEKLECDILKVAHHGSKTSTIQSFLEYTNAKMALIGVGKGNKFGHPNIEVLNRLKMQGTQIYRTDENGEINIIINNKSKIKVRRFIK